MYLICLTSGDLLHRTLTSTLWKLDKSNILSFFPKACVISVLRLNNFHIISSFYPMTDQPEHSCSHCQYKCIQWDSATTVIATILEKTIHKSAGRLVYMMLNIFTLIKSSMTHILCMGAFVMFLHPFIQIFPWICLCLCDLLEKSQIS